MIACEKKQTPGFCPLTPTIVFFTIVANKEWISCTEISSFVLCVWGA